MKTPRKALVMYKEETAGYITETDNGYTFQYDDGFFKKNIPIAVSLPPRAEPYYSKELFPFFKGLLPEGWYLDIVSVSQKVDRSDAFGLLMTTSANTIGAVSVIQSQD